MYLQSFVAPFLNIYLSVYNIQIPKKYQYIYFFKKIIYLYFIYSIGEHQKYSCNYCCLLLLHESPAILHLFSPSSRSFLLFDALVEKEMDDSKLEWEVRSALLSPAKFQAFRLKR